MKFAKIRTASVPMPGEYSEDKGITVLRTENSITPLIKCGKSISELLTKTKAERERDDEDISFVSELYTKTLAGRERDESAVSFIGELMTKTEADRERDE